MASDGADKAREESKKAGNATGKAVDAAQTALAKTPAPSPNPMTNLIMADVVLRGGGRLLRHAVERGLLGARYSPGKARRIVKGRTMTQTLVGTAIARIATSSIPGALLVGGGLLAKALIDRKNKAQAQAEGAEAVERQASRAP